jgi:hypothetical protein
MLATSVGLAGIQRGLANMNGHAQRISQYGTEAGAKDLGSVAENMVGLKQSELQAKASAEVVKTANKVLGSLLDLRA